MSLEQIEAAIERLPRAELLRLFERLHERLEDARDRDPEAEPFVALPAAPRGWIDPKDFAGRIGPLPVDPLEYQRAIRAEWDREGE